MSDKQQPPPEYIRDCFSTLIDNCQRIPMPGPQGQPGSVAPGICLIECTRKSDGTKHWMMCVVSAMEGVPVIGPVAVMLNEGYEVEWDRPNGFIDPDDVAAAAKAQLDALLNPKKI